MLDDNILRIDAERKEEKKEEKERYHFSERRWGHVTRSIRLPTNTDDDKVTAQFQDGVLRVIVPKKQEVEKRKKITILG